MDFDSISYLRYALFLGAEPGLFPLQPPLCFNGLLDSRNNELREGLQADIDRRYPGSCLSRPGHPPLGTWSLFRHIPPRTFLYNTTSGTPWYLPSPLAGRAYTLNPGACSTASRRFTLSVQFKSRTCHGKVAPSITMRSFSNELPSTSR
jgi:hypothetical protein